MAETLEELVSMWSVDAEINDLELDKEAVKTAKLHSKWLKVLVKNNLRIKTLENEYTKQKKFRWLYYTGKLSEQELKANNLEPFQFILKNDVDLFLESDEKLIEIGTKIFYHKEISDFCKAVMKELANRTWQIRASIDFLKYTSGG